MKNYFVMGKIYCLGGLQCFKNISCHVPFFISARLVLKPCLFGFQVPWTSHRLMSLLTRTTTSSSISRIHGCFITIGCQAFRVQNLGRTKDMTRRLECLYLSFCTKSWSSTRSACTRFFTVSKPCLGPSSPEWRGIATRSNGPAGVQLIANYLL